MSYELRPLSLGELLDRAFTLYRRHFWLFVGIMALPSVAMLFLSLGGQILPALADDAPDQQPSPEIVFAVAAVVVVGAAIAFLLYWITYALALGATTVAVSEIYSGRTPSVASAYGATRTRIGRLVLLLFLIGMRLFLVFGGITIAAIVVGGGAAIVSPILSMLIVTVALIAGFVLVSWMFLRYSVAVPAAVLEDNTATESIERSIYLTKGSLIRVVVLFVFTVVVTYAALAVFQFPFVIASLAAGPETSTGFWLNMVGLVTGSIASALTGPLAVVAMAVLYYDIRIRKEGLDVELLIEGLRARVPPSHEPSSSAVLPG